MSVRNEAARLFFAISALILVTMISTPQSDTADVATSQISKRGVASLDHKISEKKILKKLVKKT